jgi:hypothetical protein
MLIYIIEETDAFVPLEIILKASPTLPPLYKIITKCPSLQTSIKYLSVSKAKQERNMIFQ